MLTEVSQTLADDSR